VFYRNSTYDQWEPFFSGMPNVIVSELEINYTSNSIFAATYGRGLWESDLFSLLALDAGVAAISTPGENYCGNSVAPIISLKNYGSSALTAALITYALDGGPAQSQQWNGHLITGATTDISLDEISLSQGVHLLSFSVSNPNGSVDLYEGNNTRSVEFNVGQEEVVVQINIDQYGNETTWAILDEAGETVASGGPYANTGQSGEFPQAPEVKCLSAGCYDFTIYDSYGDGICCAYGEGTYELMDGNSNSLLSGGAGWTDSETSSFCIGSLSSCASDLDADGLVGIDDFIILNSSFGQTCTDCPADIDSNGLVDISDFILMNSEFGADCNSAIAIDGSNEALSSFIEHENQKENGIAIHQDIMKVIRRQDGNDVFSVFPNPMVNERLTLLFSPATRERTMSVKLTDMLGKTVQALNLRLPPNQQSVSVEVNKSLTSGTYLIEAENEGYTYSTYIVKE